MVHLILSLDYEIFGNGAGDVMRDVVRPTARLFDICERHDAKLTIMFEVAEYWAFERYHAQLQQDLGYSPSEAMKTQATEAVKRGHDVQLHLHPQWIGALYAEGVWQLRNSCWRLADLPNDSGNEEQVTSIAGAFRRGKRTIEDIVKPVKAGYECVCFRAGGFYAQPCGEIIHSLKAVGLRADSSVVKGYRTTTPFEVDYSHVKNAKAVWWTTDTDLTEEGVPGEGVLELSVNSRMEPYWKSFKRARLRAALHRRQIERAYGGSRASVRSCGVSSVPSCRSVLKNLLKRHASTFDFCKLSCADMLRRVRELDDRRQQPIVLIGHSKDFVNDRHLDRFLAALCQRADVCFASMSDCIRDMLSTLGISKPVDVVTAGSGGLET